MDLPAAANHHQNPINLDHWFHYFDQDHDPALDFMVDDTLMLEMLDMNSVISSKQDRNYFSELGLFQDLDPIDEYLCLWELLDHDDLPLLSNYINDDYRSIDHVQCHGTSDHENKVGIASLATSTTTTDHGGSNGGGRRMKSLEFEEIAKCFEMPITMAARKLRVGCTVLKKRCRELNIKRWPHRKLKSLKTLIQSVKELGLNEEIEMLEDQKRMIEQWPEVEFTERTKKIRQACFKATYKKRRLATTWLL